MKTFSSGTSILASEVNENFTEALNDYREFTLGETIVTNRLVYYQAASGRIFLATAVFNDERCWDVQGFSKGAGVAGGTTRVQIAGMVEGDFNTITVVGCEMYLSDTSGAISYMAGTNSKIIGFSLATNKLLMGSQFSRISRYRAGAIQSKAADTERSAAGTFTWTKVKEFKCKRKGTFTVKFDLHGQGGACASSMSEGRVYKSGGVFGTTRSTTSTIYITYSEDLAFDPDDLIQLYYQQATGGGCTVYVRNFRLFNDALEPSGNIDVNTD